MAHEAAQRSIVCSIVRAFVRLFCDCPTAFPPSWTLRAREFSISLNGEFSMNMKDDASPVSASVTWTDSRGKKAVVQAGSLTMESDNPNLVAVSGDEASGFTVAPGALDGVDADENGVLGTATITATADADLGDGVKQVSAVGAVTIVAGDAAVGEIKFG